MNDVVIIPFWLAMLLAIAAIASVYHHIVAPLLRMYLSNRERHLNQKLSTQLSRQLPEFLKISRNARIDLFVNHPEVKQAINDAVHESQGTRELLEHRVRQYAEELVPGFYALFYFKVGYAIARSYVRVMYDVRVPQLPPPSLAQIPESASIVLVGNHRSNVDVVLLAYLAARTNMISFAAGEWAKAWPMSVLVRISGSYMIRRREKLPLYRKILAIHLRELVKVKMPQGIFLEGGLTRDGTIQSVKLGLMNYILSAIGEDNVADIVFLPVAFNYDQVPEDRTLIKHQQRGFQDRSRLYTLYSTTVSLSGMMYKKFRRNRAAFGRAEVSFGEPLSMQTWLAEQGMAGAPLTPEQKHAMVAPVANELIAVIRNMIPVLPVSVIATVFVVAGDKRLTELQVQNQAGQLLKQFRARNAVMSFSDTEGAEVFKEGLETLQLRKVIVQDTGYYRVDKSHEALLHYLYNSTKHFLEDVMVENQPVVEVLT